MKTRAQNWSHFAFKSVSGEKNSATAGKYRTSCMKMPGLIHQSGLLQALVFMVARDADGAKYVDHLAQTIAQDRSAKREALIERAQTAELKAYLALTRDIADVAQWFRRFAQIELGGDDDNNKDGNTRGR